ncbi:MAG: riboflavin synthase [Actinomycetota bacterium]|nr:riboflavin synthase [Actinomycetota bacterium]
MFTGLVEGTGRIVSLEPGGMTRLVVSANLVGDDARIGDSVSVNGVCLTVNEVDRDELVFHAMPETLRRTALGDLSKGSLVNLERAMGAGSRFGGHIVQGHVDGVGEVLGVRPEGDAQMWTFTASADVLRYTVEKGSVCVDGISLTVASLDEGSFDVSILPQTRENTNLRELKAGRKVNLEADVIGKYVERLMEPRLREFTNFERRVEDAV